MRTLTTYSDAVDALALSQDLLHAIAEIADESWGAGLEGEALGRTFITLQTLAMRAAKLNAAGSEALAWLAQKADRGHESVPSHLAGAVLTGDAPCTAI